MFRQANAASCSFLPPVYARWEGVQPETIPDTPQTPYKQPAFPG
jgi:hypothetical protein